MASLAGAKVGDSLLVVTRLDARYERITKIGRKWVTAFLDDWNLSSRYDIETGASDQSDRMAFLNEDAYAEFRACEEVWWRLIDRMRKAGRRPQGFTVTVAAKISELLNDAGVPL